MSMYLIGERVPLAFVALQLLLLEQQRRLRGREARLELSLLLLDLREQLVHLRELHFAALVHLAGLRELRLELPVRGERVVTLALRVHQLLHELPEREPHRLRIDLRGDRRREHRVRAARRERAAGGAPARTQSARRVRAERRHLSGAETRRRVAAAAGAAQRTRRTRARGGRTGGALRHLLTEAEQPLEAREDGAQLELEVALETLEPRDLRLGGVGAALLAGQLDAQLDEVLLRLLQLELELPARLLELSVLAARLLERSLVLALLHRELLLHLCQAPLQRRELLPAHEYIYSIEKESTVEYCRDPVNILYANL